MRHQEEDLQKACVRWFDYQYPQFRLLLHASPNGGLRNAREAARFKATGTRAGFPDLILLLCGQNYTCLAIEMKSDKGRQSDNQKKWQEVAERNMIKYVVIRSFPEFMEQIESYINGPQ